MNNRNYQNFGTTPAQTQVYPDGTIRVVQNNNQMIATTAIQQSQEQHPRQHPQIIQNMPNKIQSQAVYYSQGQGQQAVIMKSSMGSAMTTPPMSYNSPIYSVQGQTQTQQSLPLYSTSQMNIQIANTPPSTAVNTLSNGNDNSAVVMNQQNGVLNEITSSYTVAQPIQTQEAKSYSNPVFVLPSPSPPTPQMTYTTSSNSNSNIVQVQQTPPQNTPQTSSQYVITQKSGQTVGMTSNQQVILQAPPTPYTTSPTTTQVQVLNQGGQTSEVMNLGSNYVNTSMVSPYQSVTTSVNNEKELKVSPEMTSGGEKVEGQDNNGSPTDSQAVFSSSLISNPGHLFNKISISSPTSTSMYTVGTSVPVDLNNQDQNRESISVKKEGISPTGLDKDQQIKEEYSNPLDKTNKDSINDMNIDKNENKIKMEYGNNMNGITVMTTMNNASIATTLDSTVMNQSITSPQNLANNTNGMIQATPINNNSQNINMMSNINSMQGVNTMNRMNNVSYIPANVNIPGTNPPNVNINGMNTIQGVQMNSAYPTTINTMNTMNVMNGQNGNIINIPPNQANVPINGNNSINLYYNQNVVNGNPSTSTMNYTNNNIIKTPLGKGVNGYKARAKNSHIVDPDVPIEILIKRRKNTEAARRSRLRKAERIKVLTEIVHNLEEKNREYTIKIAELQEEQANWIKKETEYTTKIKQLQDRLNVNESNPEEANDENDKNSFNIATSAPPTIANETISSDTEKNTVIKKDVEKNA